MMFLIICVTATVLLLAYMAPAILRFKQRYDFAQTVPGPSFMEMRKLAKCGSFIKFLEICRQRYGPVIRLWQGFDLAVLFFDAEDIKVIANNTTLIDKAKAYQLGTDWVGKGLLLNSGESWRIRRKLLSPAFNFQILSKFKDPIEDCCKVLIGRLNAVADGRPVDIYDYPGLFSLDVVCETAMGLKVNAQLNEGSEYVKATLLMSSIIYRQMFSIWKRIPLLYLFSADYKQRKRALRILQGETKRVIASRRIHLEAEEEAKATHSDMDDEPVLGAKKRVAFLDSLLLTQRQTGFLTDANIQEEVDTFMFAGQDTTGTGIAFTMYTLATHPEVQRLAYEEVCCIDTFDPNLSLPYLEAVIKETLRIYPSVPSFSRETNETTIIGKYTIPANVTINIPGYHVHREEKYFPNAELFQPERFLHDVTNPFANVIFGIGPRYCIGMRFAMLEMKCTLTRLLQAFEFSAVAGFKPEIEPSLTLKSRNGLVVQLRKRNR